MFCFFIDIFSKQVMFSLHLMISLILSTDINECISGSAECHDNATCTNTDGSYECTCDFGFFGDGINCKSEIVNLCISSLIPMLLHNYGVCYSVKLIPVKLQF